MVGPSVRFTSSPFRLQNGYWADYFCEMELGYICKREPLVNASVEPEVADAHCQKVRFKQTG